MAQFSVYENINQETRETMPYLVDVQNDFLQDLQTRVVIPLCPSPPLLEKPIDSLTPTVAINGSPYIVLTPQMAGIHISDMGPFVCDLSAFRDRFISALDFLFTGF